MNTTAQEPSVKVTPGLSGPDPAAATILIVDDVEVNRQLLHDQVLTLGHRPVMAVGGWEALAQFETCPPDLVLLDMLMPGMDGLEVLRRLKANPEWRHVPVVIISAVDAQDAVVRCIEEGAEDYLTKPFHAVMLRARISSCLLRKRNRDEEQRIHRQLLKSHQDLQAAEADRDALVHMIVHDLKNTLTCVAGHMQLVMENTGSAESLPPGLEDGLREMRRSADEMEEMVADILDVSRLEHGKLQPELAPVSLAELLNESANRVRPLAESERKHVQVNLDAPGIAVRADSSLLRRILLNLTDNAVKHTPVGSQVTLAATRRNGCVQVRVEDNGHGVPASQREAVFEKYAQVGSRKSGGRRGSGLGLPFCRLATEAQGGRIFLEPRESEGAVFVVELPACSPEELAAHRAAGAGKGEAETEAIPVTSVRNRVSPVNILIVDDHAMIRRGIRTTLSRGFPGARFGEAHDAAAALQLLESEVWHLVTLDMSMPGMSGLELLKKLKRRNPEVPVLVLTMHSDNDFVTRAMQARASGFLLKDCQERELVSAVDQILEGRIYITERVGDLMAHGLRHGMDGGLPHHALSDREFEVFMMIAGGRTVSEVAREFALSVKTVSTYRTRILAKMKMSTNADIMRYAARHKFL